MAKTLSAWEARRQFGKVLRDVSRDGESFIVESHGEPVAAVVPITVLEDAECSEVAVRACVGAKTLNAAAITGLTEDEPPRSSS